MGTLENQLPLTEVARLAEVSLPAVSNWRARHSDFPSAQRTSGQDTYLAREIAQWLSTRKISAKDRKKGEGPGVTYADRFLRNLGPISTSITESPGRTLLGVEELTSRFWRVAERSRTFYDRDLFIELVFGLLYLKSRDPEQWQRLRVCRGTSEAETLIARYELPPTPSAPHARLFRSSSSHLARDHALADLVHLIDEIFRQSRGDAGATASSICDDLLLRMDGPMRRSGDIVTPISLAKLMVSLVDPQPGCAIYDPFCRLGELLAAAANHMFGDDSPPGPMQFSGQAISERWWHLTKLHMALHGVSAELGTHPSQALREDLLAPQKFDVVLGNPPFNMRNWAAPDKPQDMAAWTYGAPPAMNGNFAWLQHVVSKLKPGGRAAVLMANSSTTSQNAAEAAIRASMVEAGIVECIVALPDKLFDATKIPVSLWLLRNAEDRVNSAMLFIDAKSMGTMASRVQRVITDEDIARVQQTYHTWRAAPTTYPEETMEVIAKAVSYMEIAENNYTLNPSAYIRPAIPLPDPKQVLDKFSRLCAELSALRAKANKISIDRETELADVAMSSVRETSIPGGWTKATLGDVCKLLAGPGAVDRHESEPNSVAIVLPRNIKQNRVSAQDLDAVSSIVASKMARYRLNQGDIICTRTGTLGRYGLVQGQQEGWLLGPGCIRLRPRHAIDARYLTYYLSTPTAQDWVAGNATGSAIRHISVDTLRRLPLVVPPLAIQHRIATVLGTLDEESSLHQELGATARELQDLLLPMFLTGIAE